MIFFQIIGRSLEMHPAEHQRESDGKGHHATPGQAHVHDPAIAATLGDELLRADIVKQ